MSKDQFWDADNGGCASGTLVIIENICKTKIINFRFKL